MILSEEQQNQLLVKIREGIANWQIAGWLVEECGLSYRQAAQERFAALEVIKNEKNKEQEQRNKVIQKERLEAFEASIHSPSQDEGVGDETGASSEEIESEESAPQKIECLTCGDPTFSCDCSDKKISDIPF